MTTASRTRTSAASRRSAGAAQAANAENLKAAAATPAPVATPAPAPAAGTNGTDLTARANAIIAQGDPNKMTEGTTPTQTNDANLQPPRVSHAVLVSSVKSAAASFKAAINLEVAVACAVFLTTDDTSPAAKKELYSVYKDAGYDCDVGGTGKDYKTVNRRIGYAAKFYDSLEAEVLPLIVGDAKDEAAIQTLVAHLSAKYNFRSMNDVLYAAGLEPPTRKAAVAPAAEGAAPAGQPAAAAPTATPAPAPAPVTGVPSEADKGVMAAVAQAGEQRQQEAVGTGERREYDDQSKWLRHEYEGATIILPLDMSPSTLGELGIKLMHAANQMRGSKIDAPTLNAEFEENVAAH